MGNTQPLDGTRRWVVMASSDALKQTLMDEISNVVANSAGGLRSILRWIAWMGSPDQGSGTGANDPNQAREASSMETVESREETNPNDPPGLQLEDYGKYVPFIFCILYVTGSMAVLFYFGDVVT